jgi:hypothetical protein
MATYTSNKKNSDPKNHLKLVVALIAPLYKSLPNNITTTAKVSVINEY